jgi:hypothetical protein
MIQIKFTWGMTSYRPELLMLELPAFITAMEKRDKTALVRIPWFNMWNI